MSAAGDGHTHASPDRRPFDWFTALDILVWASVGLLLVLAAEWAYGTIVRERIARGAQRHLKKVTAEHPTE